MYPLFKGLFHSQGLDVELGFTYISGRRGFRHWFLNESLATQGRCLLVLESPPILEESADKSNRAK